MVAVPAVLAVLAMLAGLPACTGQSKRSSPADSARAKALLASAKAKLDAATSVHFTVSSADVPKGTSSLVGGNGVAARPDGFKGDLQVAFGGAQVSVGVISVGGKTYAKLPFTTGYAVTDPKKYGLSDPGKLLDPQAGISTLLARAKDPKLGRRVRIGGEVVQEVTATIPGTAVNSLLPSADPAKSIRVTFSVVEGSKELRQAVVTGPFFKKGIDSTYTIVLDRYGDKVDIRAPNTG